MTRTNRFILAISIFGILFILGFGILGYFVGFTTDGVQQTGWYGFWWFAQIALWGIIAMLVLMLICYYVIIWVMAGDE